MPARAAAEIEDRHRVGVEVRECEGDLPPGGSEVAMRIQLEIFLPEPGFPPRHAAGIMAACPLPLPPGEGRGEGLLIAGAKRRLKNSLSLRERGGVRDQVVGLQFQAWRNFRFPF